jgi:hypothetical protein
MTRIITLPARHAPETAIIVVLGTQANIDQAFQQILKL